MTDHIRKAIEELEQQLLVQETKAAETKTAINTLCGVVGEPIRYASVAPEHATPSLSNIKPDQFFGKPLAGAVKAYLNIKGSAARVDEIHDALSRGGFTSIGKDQKKNLRISLTKNSSLFAYVRASDTFGLWEWYGGKPKRKPLDDTLEGAEEEAALENQEEEQE